jgi:hypothetical protein
MLMTFTPDKDPVIYNLLTPLTLDQHAEHSTTGTSNAYNAEEKPLDGILFCTMLSEDFANYAHGAIRLIRSVKHDPFTAGIDTAVLQLAQYPVPSHMWAKLQKAGWGSLITLERIPPRHEGRELYARFKDQFLKLHLWNMTAYKWVFYMDSDILILRSLGPMIRHVVSHSGREGQGGRVETSMWAIEDLPWDVDKFNAGILAIRPNASEFDMLRGLLNSSIPFDEKWAEQGFLNAVYNSSWGRIPARMALNMAFWDLGADIWNTYAKEAQAIHFTMMKPWTSQCMWSQYAPLCYLFWHEEALRFHEVHGNKNIGM